jgi:hypothetical protein
MRRLEEARSGRLEDFPLGTQSTECKVSTESIRETIADFGVDRTCDPPIFPLTHISPRLFR